LIRDDRVNVGHLVDVEDVDSGESLTFHIVGSRSGDPFANPPKVANDAPIGTGLIDKAVGDVVEISIPDGKLHYKVTGISKVK
jgi:transcription elongation factor GreA